MKKMRKMKKNIKHLLIPIFLLLVLLQVYFCLSVCCAGTFAGEPQEVITGSDAAPWERIERLADTAPGFIFEPFHPACRQRHTILKKAFGSEEPHSKYFLLHYAPGWNKNTGRTPVILVHGAGSHAFHSWAHPYCMQAPEPENIDKPGLMQFLVKNGYPVFAITFSHPHGDNFLQAQQLANAVDRIKTVLKGGDSFKVNVVCHSKGAMPVRIYLSSAGADYEKYKWITQFRKDVDKVIFVASPLKGLDTSYRYYAYCMSVMLEDIGAPMAPQKLMYMGSIVDLKNYNDKFPGQDQMLYNWVKDGIPFSFQSFTPDMNFTMYALYNGGETALLRSNGIDKAIADSGNVIETLCRKGIDPSVTAYILAGNKKEIDCIQFGPWKIPIGEMAAESDGVLFLKSAVFKRGLTARGACVKTVKTVKTHHVGLIVLPEALDFIEEALSGRNNN